MRANPLLLRRHDDGSYFIGPSVMGLANAFVSRTGEAQEFANLLHEFGTLPDETVILSVRAFVDEALVLLES